MTSEPTTPDAGPILTARTCSYRIPPSPAWPGGLRLELAIGRRKRIRRLARQASGAGEPPWAQVGFGLIAAACRVRPGS